MLRSLFIQNYALIAKLDISFDKGFSVITGETGAGKSIMLGAIGLLLGQRADVKAIRQGENRCIIEAHFDVSSYHLNSFFEENDLDYDDDCIIRREIHSNGKSRAFINDVPTQLSLLKILGDKLIDVHSQHQNLLLNTEDFQLKVLDLLAHNEVKLSDYVFVYKSWKETERELAELKEISAKSKSDEEYIRYQLSELEEAKLKEGEENELQEEYDTLTHAEDIKEALSKVNNEMNTEERGILGMLKESCSTLKSILSFYPSVSDLAERMSSSYIELKDIADEISDREDNLEINSERLQEVTDRLNLIHALLQKHQVHSVSELLDIAEQYRKQINGISSSEEHIEELTVRLAQLYKEVEKQAKDLTNSRTNVASVVEKEMADRLALLDMPNVCFQVKLETKEVPGIKGRDNVYFLFSANKNSSLQNISSVASGGEIARVMLCIKAMIAGVVKLPTIIFDEIDTGVSGKIADKMAVIMKEMSKDDRQVISITHLPQIASHGKVHYKVYKEDTEKETNSHIVRLTEQQRVQEIAHMLSGTILTDAAINNARALLEAGQK